MPPAARRVQHARWNGPKFDGHICSLGYEVLDWIHTYCCHGPGDVQGEPLDYDDEIRAFIIECYRLDEVTGRRVYREAVLSRPKGRALALDTPVPTPTGWTTMGALHVGDIVFDEQGSPTEVLDVSDVMIGHPCFEVRFSDGERIVADAEHLWTVEELRKEYRQVTVDTATLRRYRSTRGDGAANYRLQMNGPLDLPEVDLPIDPYILGAWLGDGNNRDSRFTVHMDDLSSFRAQVELAGYYFGRAVLQCTTYDVRVSSSEIVKGRWNGDSLVRRLRDEGLLQNKHVPAAYLRAGYKQRLAILQGLMDTDGCIGTDGRAAFTSTRRQLAADVAELLATLGVKCSILEGRAKLDGVDCGPVWKVDFWPTMETPVFRLPRKLERQRVRTPRGRLADTRRVVAVDPAVSVPVRCITVAAASSLFLVGRRMVQTHNSKSEIAGMVAVAEGLGPVRFDGWDADGQPVGRPVRSPLIKALATEESQAGNTFQNAAFVAGEWGPDVHPDIYGGTSGVRRYQSATAVYLPGGGEIRACTAGAASKDGGKETFVVPDESHLYVLPELRNMYATVMRNLPKRRLAEPWALQTTTAYRPGEQSIAEDTLTAWRKGELSSTVYVNHREGKGRINIDDRDHTIAQLLQVYGAAMHPVTGWMDPNDVYETMTDPRQCPDHETAARYYLNRSMSSKDAWIAKDIVERQVRPEVLTPGTAVALGFDGSLRDDATVLYASRMSDGWFCPIGIWAKPAGVAGNWWEVPRSDVLAAIREAFSRYTVSRAYMDPHEWRSDIDALAEEFGEERVLPWETRRDVAMAAALDRLRTDLITGVVWHSGDPLMIEHFANAYVRMKAGHRLVRKEHPQSDRKIDSVPGAALAYEARADAIAAGWAKPEPSRRVTILR